MKKYYISGINSIISYLSMLKDLMLGKLLLTSILMVFISITEGLGLLLLIPLLQLVGINTQQGNMGQIENYLMYIFNFLGLQPNLVIVIGLFIFVMIINALLNRSQSIMASEIQYKFANSIRKQLFISITNSNWLFFSRNRSSDFAHALLDEVDRIGIGTNQLLSFFTNFIVIIIYIFLALKVSWTITLLISIIGAFLLVLINKKVQNANLTGEKISEEFKNLYSATNQHLDGMKTIKSYGMQDHNINLYSQITNNVAFSYVKAVKNYADVNFFFEISSVIVLGLIVILMIEFLSTPTGELLLLIFIFGRLIPRFSTLQDNYQYFLNMIPSFNNVIELKKRCNKAYEIKENELDKILLKKEIKFKKIKFSYETDNCLINDLNLTIPAFKTTAIIGSSGAGKSTIVDLLMGIIKPLAGSVLIDDTPLNENNILAWRKHIGYVEQDTFLFNDTVRNNLLVAQPDANDKDIKIALNLASADLFVNNLSMGLETILGDRGVRLSGGEKQRLSLARALLRKPSLLILDEATSNLDSENEKKILNSIKKLHGNITILVIAHRLSTIRNADNIYVLEMGSIIESGTWNELIKNENGHFKMFYELQS